MTPASCSCRSGERHSPSAAGEKFPGIWLSGHAEGRSALEALLADPGDELAGELLDRRRLPPLDPAGDESRLLGFV